MEEEEEEEEEQLLLLHLCTAINTATIVQLHTKSQRYY